MAGLLPPAGATPGPARPAGPPLPTATASIPQRLPWLPSLPSGEAVSHVSPETLISGKSGCFLAVAGQSSRLPAVLVHPAPASVHLPGPVWEHPLGPAAATRAAPTGRTRSVGKGGPRQGHTGLLVDFEGKERWRGRQLEASGATAVSRRGAVGGAGLLLGCSPSQLRVRPREGAEGWQRPGALPRPGWSPRRLLPGAPLPHSPPAGGVLGSGCGTSRGGRAG